MGWFSKKKAPDPVPVEPVYSELGTAIYELLEQKEGEWRLSEYWNSRRQGIEHQPTGIFIHIAYNDSIKSVLIQQGGDGTPIISRLMTADDLSRIESRAMELITRWTTSRDHEHMKSILEGIKPNPFDRDCRQLARLVLEGDASAARPMLDKMMESLQEMGS